MRPTVSTFASCPVVLLTCHSVCVMMRVRVLVQRSRIETPFLTQLGRITPFIFAESFARKNTGGRSSGRTSWYRASDVESPQIGHPPNSTTAGFQPLPSQTDEMHSFPATVKRNSYPVRSADKLTEEIVNKMARKIVTQDESLKSSKTNVSGNLSGNLSGNVWEMWLAICGFTMLSEIQF